MSVSLGRAHGRGRRLRKTGSAALSIRRERPLAHSLRHRRDRRAVYPPSRSHRVAVWHLGPGAPRCSRVKRTSGPAANHMPIETSTSCQNHLGSGVRKGSSVKGHVANAATVIRSHATRYQCTRARATSTRTMTIPSTISTWGRCSVAPKPQLTAAEHIERPDVVGKGDECEPSHDGAANPAAHHVEKEQRDGESHEVVAVAQVLLEDKPEAERQCDQRGKGEGERTDAAPSRLTSHQASTMDRTMGRTRDVPARTQPCRRSSVTRVPPVMEESPEP